MLGVIVDGRSIGSRLSILHLTDTIHRLLHALSIILKQFMALIGRQSLNSIINLTASEVFVGSNLVITAAIMHLGRDLRKILGQNLTLLSLLQASD